MLQPQHFFNLSQNKYGDLFNGIDLVWETLTRISDYLKANLKPGIYGSLSPLAYVNEKAVYIGPGTVVEPGAVITGPAIIGANCEVRTSAYVGANVIVGDRVVIGHSTELKNSVLFDEVSVPHFAYVGDSILGWKVHLGAGVKISNFKINQTPVAVTINNRRYETGLLKFGAILGDEADIGCNSVLNPGTLVGKRTLVYPNSSIRGYFPPDCIVKLRQTFEVVQRN